MAKSRGKYTVEELETYWKICGHRKMTREELFALAFQERDRSTNWHRDGEVPKTKRPFMLGEGLGNNLGLDGPKYTEWLTYEERLRRENENIKYEREKKEAARAKKQRDKFIQAQFVANIPHHAAEGRLLVGQRIFMAWPKGDWEVRAKKLGGLPDGVDVALTSYGTLIIVPVIETEENGRKDRHGRLYQIEAKVREAVQYIFSMIKWSQPLTVRDAEQFGVSFQ